MQIDEVQTGSGSRARWRHSAARVMRRLDELALCSDSKTGLTRTFLSPAMNKAHELVANWMREAGLTPRVDEMGNLIGYLPCPQSPGTDAVWLLGSHLDTVPNAGKYDGMLGVLLAIEMVSQLENPLPFAIEVIGFSEEEGVRFKTPYLGSRALTGTFDPQFFELLDQSGISMRQALQQFGLVPENWQHAQHRSTDILGYFEAHIEQGPLLESLDAPLGIVTDIVGQSRLRLRFGGQSGHAGTLPMSHRRDALVAASEWVVAVESHGSTTSGLVATVGSIEVGPNTPNVVPGDAVCSLDVRHASDDARENAVDTLLELARIIAARRKVNFEVLVRASQKAVPMNPHLRAKLQSACERVGVFAPEMSSGAGHDAAIMATIAPCAMLFLRTPGGASHCPEEAVAPADVALALEAMNEFFTAMTHYSGEPI